MVMTNRKPAAASRVTALFKDSAVCFLLPEGATLEDLAERLADLGEHHGGVPLQVDVRVGA